LNRSRISSKRHRHFQALGGNVAHGSLAGQNLTTFYFKKQKQTPEQWKQNEKPSKKAL